MVYNYRAYNREGEVLVGAVQADNKDKAVYQLYQQGLIADEVVQAEKAAGVRSAQIDTLITFTKLLSTALEAHIPLARALEFILEEFPKKSGFRIVILSLINELKSGKSFFEVLGLYKNIFSPFYRNMVRMGEKSGKLDKALSYILNYLQKRNEVRKKIGMAMLYPSLILGFAAVVLIFFITVIIPRFEESYAQFGGQLPVPTLILMRISVWFRNYFIFIIVFTALTAFLLYRWLLTPQGRRIAEKILFSIPIAGNILIKDITALFCRTVSLLLYNGVTLKESLELSGELINNSIFKESIKKAAADLTGGRSFSRSLKDNPIIPPMLVQMAGMGEESGKLPELLDSLAGFYEKELDLSIEKITSLITPVMIMFIGLIVGAIILCLFLPIFNISQMVK